MTRIRRETTGEIELPDDAVVIADEALPATLLEGFETPLEVTAGESLKTLDRVEQLAEQVLERRASRPMTIVAVGGGSVGDAVGFLASILWRGVDLWHVPTTLLAMGDSAHGGKTAVNLGEAKNQLGTFYPADRVILVEEALETLPLEQRRDGLVELIKSLWIGAPDTFELLESEGGVSALASAPFEAIGDRLMALLERAIDVKLDIVERDPYEQKGIRTHLNLGHTVAHGLELEAGLSHGQAVAWGLVACSYLSEASSETSFDSEDGERWRRHLYPLIASDPSILAFDDWEAFAAAMRRDKKHVEGELRSVRLQSPGDPKVTTAHSIEDWQQYTRESLDWMQSSHLRLERTHDHSATLNLESSKSEMNRALVIRHLRHDETHIEGDSRADDVRYLRDALQKMKEASGDRALELECGRGGTTLRFLMAVAAHRPSTTILRVAPSLMERPHTPLVEALERGGAKIEELEGESSPGYRVRGWSDVPDKFRVDVSQSSQFGSALALLAATGSSITLHLDHDGDAPGLEGMPSRPYFEMTLDLLRDAGLDISIDRHTINITPGVNVEGPVVLRAESDASSAAVWSVANFLGVEVEIADPPRSGRQPDAAIESMLTRLSRERAASSHSRAPVIFDLGDAPDLVPVLAVAATQSPDEVHLTGASHLHHKESDRIHDLAHAMERVGLEITPTEEGMIIPEGRQCPTPEAMWPTHEDHRLAMAGLLATLAGEPLVIEAPLVVTKSYPRLWFHARRLGWSTVPHTADRERETHT